MKTAGILFLAALIAALAVATATGQMHSPQRWEYSTIAQNILQGRGAVYDYFGTEYHFYGPALYPFLLAAVLKISGQREAAVLILQAVIYALTCALIYQIAQPLFGQPAAVLAFLLALFHPGNLIYAGKLHPQTLDVFFIVLSFLLLMRLGTMLSPAKAFGAGCVAGLAALCRGTIAPLFLLWTLWFLWKERNRPARAWGVATGLALGMALIFSPIILHGYRLYGTLIPLRTDTGMNLWYGNHPGASGTSYTLGSHPVPVTSELPAGLLAKLGNANEVGQNWLLTEASMQFIRENPAEAARLFIRKTFYFWWFSPHTGLLYPQRWLNAYKVYYTLVLFLAVWGLVEAFRSARPGSRKAAILFLLIAGSVSVSQSLFYVEGRHRWQIEPLLLLFTAVGAARLLQLLNPGPTLLLEAAE